MPNVPRRISVFSVASPQTGGTQLTGRNKDDKEPFIVLGETTKSGVRALTADDLDRWINEMLEGTKT